MTTAEIYRPPSGGPRTTADVAGPITELARLRRVAASFEFVPVLTTAAEARSARLRVELAERSVSPNGGLDRHLGDEINRNGWGIRDE